MSERAPVPSPRLLILAGGLGRRFGGAKQVEPVGPDGAWLMDYTVTDALRLGFGHVVCVVRPGIREVVADHLEALAAGRAGVTLVEQTLEAALPAGAGPPAGRDRPWGTAHAVLVAEHALPGPFAVANADDVYGRESLAGLARALPGTPDSGVLVGYPLGDTLSPHGPVNRGLCRTDGQGRLLSVQEAEGIHADDRGVLRGTVAGRPVALEAHDLVSMNLWGLGSGVFPVLRRAFHRFLADPERRARGELALPDAIGEAVADGRLRIRLLACGRGWIGMTHPSDRARVSRALAALGPPERG